MTIKNSKKLPSFRHIKYKKMKSIHLFYYIKTSHEKNRKMVYILMNKIQTVSLAASFFVLKLGT